MIKKASTFLIVLSILTSCGDSTSNKQKELDLKEKELGLKEKELKLKEREDSLVNYSNPSKTDNKNNELSNIENLIGYWFIPHVAVINIRFNRDGRFEFNDYNSTLEKDEILTGTYQLENGTLILYYDDRPKQKFKFYRGESGDDNYYIKKSDYYFVKGESGY